MSKKTFMKITWKETGSLLVVDLIILVAFAFWNVWQCMFQSSSVIIISPQLICPYLFFTNIQNIIFLFVAALVVNFIISGVWHFVVKK